MVKPTRWISLLTVLLLVLTVSPAAAASKPLDVKIVVTTYFVDTGNSGPFTATGPAVDAGLICPSGAATDIYNRGSGYESKHWTGGANYFVLKQFVCDNGRGTFTLKMEARVVFPKDTAVWNVLNGTGAYEKLLGAGNDIGEFFLDSTGTHLAGIIDTIEGKLH